MSLMSKNIFLVFFFFANVVQGITQEVLISKDINVRNDAKFILLGKIQDNLLLFRDKEQKQFVEVFDDQLKYKYQREISLNERGSRIYSVLPSEEHFSIVYGLMDRDSIRFRLRQIDGSGELIDSLQLSALSRKNLSGKFKFSYSLNNEKLLLFTRQKKDELFMLMIDLKEKETLWASKLFLEESSTNVEFKDIVVSNDGQAFFLFEKSNNRYERKSHAFFIYPISGQSDLSVPIEIPYPEYLSKDIHLSLDEHNKQLLLIGLFAEANRSSALGYFYYLSPYNSLASQKINTISFQEDFINEVYGKQRKVNNSLDYYFIKDVLFKQDGSFIWVGEMFKEYFRRTSNPYGRYSRNYDDTGGYVDYYNEDMIVISVDKEGNEDWKKVLYKKQFSQDDDAIYSSFFLMKTPSRIKLLYNDEIKKNNTVSEYMLDPLGNSHRKAVLNTEYENLRLQFTEAIQIGSASLILPSYNASLLNLVKISF